MKQDLEFVANSLGQVHEFFARTPCKSLDRVLFAIGDDQGNTVPPDGKMTVIAEAEPATGQVSDKVLDAVADVAALLPRP